jgi:hypothetical protein
MQSARVLALLAGVVVLTIARSAHAEDDAARAHFEEGRRLSRAERWQEATVEFRASLVIEPSIGGHLNLGNAYAKLGKVASAVDQFRRAEHLAGTKDAERAKEARARRDELAARVPTVTVTTSGGAAITVDTQKVESGVPIEVDPGSHAVVVATAHGTRRTLDVDVGAGDHAKVVVAGEDAPPQLALDPRVAPPPTGVSPLPTIGWIGIGTGAAALVASGVFYALAISDKKELEETCRSYPRCRSDEIASARTLDDSAHTKTTIATIGFASGLGLLAAGGVLLLLAPKQGAREAREPPVAFSLSPGRQGLAASAFVRW